MDAYQYLSGYVGYRLRAAFANNDAAPKADPTKADHIEMLDPVDLESAKYQDRYIRPRDYYEHV